jgi:hypothetical protein
MTDTKIKSPDEFVAALFPDSKFPLSDLGGPYRCGGSQAIEADREALALWCDEQAKDAWDSMRGSGGDREEGCMQQGQSMAFEAVAAYLRGAS